jgi:hypothetical protein
MGPENGVSIRTVDEWITIIGGDLISNFVAFFTCRELTSVVLY